MDKSKLQFCHRFRVRYAEIDAQGIVFNANYLVYFDTALAEFYRMLGMTFATPNDTKPDYDYHTVRAVVEFHAPVHYDDVIDVYVAVARIGNSSLTFNLYIYRADETDLLTSGEIVWVYANQSTNKSAPLPDTIRNKLAPYLLPE